MHLETQRLIIREIELNDARFAHTLFTDEEAMRLVGMHPISNSMDFTKSRIERWMKHKIHKAIALKDTNEFIGYIVIKPSENNKNDAYREIGFALIEEYRNKGLMKEALIEVINELFNLGIVEIEASCFKENKESKSLIKSLGFTFINEGKYQPPNDKVYETLNFSKRKSDN